MKNKILTAISTIMLFVPWTILPLRTFDWALKSPVAEIMIYSYAAFMIFSGIFSILAYTKGKVKSKLMQVCVVNLYQVSAPTIPSAFKPTAFWNALTAACRPDPKLASIAPV